MIRHLSSGVPWPYPENGVYSYIRDQILPHQGKNRWDWGLFLKTNPEEMIGGIALWQPGEPENRGFWLGQKFWGQGLMTEAIDPISEYAFYDLGFDKLILTNAKGNLRSRRIKEKSGAQFIGVNKRGFVDPQYQEHEIWEQTRAAFFKATGRDGGIRRYAQSDDTARWIWNIPRIWKLAESLPPEEISIETVVGLDSVTWFSSEQKPTIRSIAGHAKRIHEADLNYPPILTSDFRVFDGMHRIAKHLMLGHKTLLVKRFPINPEPDRIDTKRMD